MAFSAIQDCLLGSAPVISLADGSQLKGRVEKGLWIFRNVPYAEAPVDFLRFKPPVPKLAWQGVRDCSRHGTAAMQCGILLQRFLEVMLEKSGSSAPYVWAMKNLLKMVPLTPPDSEDCLSLCIKTPPPSSDFPSDSTPELKPVMVWFHGGDFQDGCSFEPFYEAEDLPKEGVVVVYVNYRLNVFGFFAHPDLAAETPAGDVAWGGDAGTRDKLEALRWVQRNILAFGGDKDNVTIFGESAGAEAVLNLMSAPQAQGLFHKAIAQSPASNGRFLARREAVGIYPSAEENGVRFATRAVGPEPGQLQRLRQLPAKELQTAYQAMLREIAFGEVVGVGFYPIAGTQRDAGIVADAPLRIFLSGRQIKVPLIIGINSEEASCCLPVSGPNKSKCFWNPNPCVENEAHHFTPATAAHLLQLYAG